MKILFDFFENRVLTAAVLGWLCAQVAKLLFTLIFTRKLNPERLWGSGGMPSAHSSMACALTISMARVHGIDTPLFALTVMFAFVTMYDAMGVRREAGEHAKLLNKYLNEIEAAKADKNGDGIPDEKVNEIELKEFIGHTPLEVLGGVLLGIIIGILIPV
ncbi:MAG: divergent PAP2 family protein [Oscillospiraceae bacterium]|nr:divergent PAP2 family protein [Oscillospiraceae bacterium]MDD4413660.1 divergent PAP2 family protein [Oscillospiraceae bacterium]